VVGEVRAAAAAGVVAAVDRRGRRLNEDADDEQSDTDISGGISSTRRLHLFPRRDKDIRRKRRVGRAASYCY
jgi:hypothetical protein